MRGITSRCGRRRPGRLALIDDVIPLIVRPEFLVEAPFKLLFVLCAAFHRLALEQLMVQIVEICAARRHKVRHGWRAGLLPSVSLRRGAGKAGKPPTLKKERVGVRAKAVRDWTTHVEANLPSFALPACVS